MMNYEKLKRYHAAATFAMKLIMSGYQPEQVMRKIRARYKGISAKLAYQIGKCRIKAKRKFDIWDLMLIDEFGLRYSTPDPVAEYIAKRLSCSTIADLGCGIGAQARFFGKYSSKVICVEKDEVRASFAYWNLKQYGVEFEVIQGDAFDSKVVERVVSEAEIIFSDPSRPEWEKGEKLPKMSPDPRRILKVYSKRWRKEEYAFQLPPQMSPKEVPIPGEREYLSYNSKLNRLTVYLGELAKWEKSVVKIPGEHRLVPSEEEVKVEEAESPKSFLYIVDPAVVKAEMIEDLVATLNGELFLYLKDPRRTSLTSEDLMYSPFFESIYEVLEVIDVEPGKIREAAKKHGAKKVTLRIKIDPKRYWEFRRKIEEGLEGEEHLYLIEGKEGKGILAKKLSPKPSRSLLIGVYGS